MEKLIDPEEIYSSLQTRLNTLENKADEATKKVVLIEKDLEGAREEAALLRGQYTESKTLFAEVTALVETSNKKWDEHVAFLEDKYAKETQARFDTFEKSKEDFYILGHNDATTEIKDEYKLTKKKVKTRTKKKPLQVAKSIVRERARKKLDA
ncbi:hypothetical protein H8D85_01740 [bacterium]|nr:hypothetical protein [bacterium]